MALSGGGFGRGRRLAEAAEGLGTALVVAVLVGVLVYAANRPALRHRFDLTETDQYTLTGQTRKILSNLEDPVSITTIFRPEPQVIPNGLFDVQARAAEYVRSMLQEYTLASAGRLQVRHLDPLADRVEADELVRQFNLARYNVVLVQRGDRTRQVYLEDLATIDRGLADPNNIRMAELIELHAERPLTSALLSLASERTPRVAFLVGLAGPELGDFDVGGLGLLAQALRGQGLDVEELDLRLQPSVPEDVDVVAVVGPRYSLGAEATHALLEFSARGGRLLLAVDPWFDDQFLEQLMEELGVGRERAVLCLENPLQEGTRRAVLALRRFHGEHPITAPIARQGLFAIMAPCGGLGRLPSAPAQRLVEALAFTDGEVFGDKPGVDSPGDFSLGDGEVKGVRAVAYAVEEDGPRAVVFGGSGFLTNSFLDSTDGAPGNLDLALNSFNWLVERDYAVEARPKEVFESRVQLYDEERESVFLYVVLLMPLAGALLGILVWFLRRR